MVKYLIIFYFVSFNAFSKIEYHFSKIHNQIKFLEQLNDSNNLFWNEYSKEEKKLLKNYVSRFYRIKSNNFRDRFSINLKNYKDGKQSLWSIIVWQSIESNDLAEFDSRILGLTNINTHVILIELLKKSQKLFERVWIKNKNVIEKKLSDFDKFTNEKNVLEIINKSRTFYNTNWPNDRAFPIGLFLIPNKQELSSGASFNMFQEASIRVRDTVKGRMGVIIHELNHSFFANQEPKTFSELEKFYTSSNNIYARFAFQYLNEGLATAIGNGIFEESIGEDREDHPLYNDLIIDRYARSIKSEIEVYFKKNKPMDKNFYSLTIKRMKARFPQLAQSARANLNKFLVSGVGLSDVNKMAELLGKQFNSQTFHMSTPFWHEFTIEDYMKAELGSVLIIQNPKQGELLKIYKTYPRLKKSLSSFLQANIDYKIVVINKKFHLFIKYRDINSFKTLIKKISDNDKLY